MIALLLLVLAGGVARADTPLDGLPSELRERFEGAEAAWDRGALDEAEAGFDAVVTALPTFDRAWRRRCGVRLVLDRPTEALADCRQAVALHEGPENHTALALALVHARQLDEAHRLLEGVLAAEPDYEPAHTARCAWAAAARDARALDGCATRLEATTPGTAGAFYYRGLALIEAGDLSLARDVLLAAQQEGLPEDLLVSAAERLTQKARVARKARARQPRRAEAEARRQDEAGAWTLPDLVPLLVAAALAIAVAVLWFGREGAEDDGQP